MFKWRKKNVVDEAGSYLKATDTVSRPVAIMLTLATMVIILALLFLVFLGGRWVYRKIWSQDDNRPTSGLVEKGTNTQGEGGAVGTGTGTSGSDLQPTGSAQNQGRVRNNQSEEPSNVPATGGNEATPTPGVIPDTGPSQEYEP